MAANVEEVDETTERGDIMTTETQIQEPTLIVTVWHDPYTEGPNQDDGLFKLVSFNRRHVDSADPEKLFACEECGEVKDDWRHGTLDDYVAELREIRSYYRGEDAAEEIVLDPEEREELTEELHDYQPPVTIASMLNYYEHGLCRWYVAPSASPVDMQWDGAYNAGVLLVKERFLDEWEGYDQEQRQRLMESFVEEYTDWANGSTYGYTIERRAGVCHCCGRELDPEIVDSCGGFIGTKYIAEEIKAIIAGELGITTEEVREGVHFTAKGDEYGDHHAYMF